MTRRIKGSPSIVFRLNLRKRDGNFFAVLASHKSAVISTATESAGPMPIDFATRSVFIGGAGLMETASENQDEALNLAASVLSEQDAS